MATPTTRCPECRTILKTAAPIPAGKKLKCPKCGIAFHPDDPAEPAPSTDIQLPGTAEPTIKKRPYRDEDDDDARPARRSSRRRDHDDDDDRRRPERTRKQAEGGSGVVIALVAAVVLSVVGAGGMVAWRLMAAPNVPDLPVAPIKAANAAPGVNQADKVADPAPAAGGAADAIPVAVMQNIKRATAFIKLDAGDQSSTGSGFLMKVNGDTGYLITNYHVVAPPAKEEAQPAPPAVGPGKSKGPKFFPPTPKSKGPFGPGFGGPFSRMQPAQQAPKARPRVTVVLHSGTPEEQSIPAEVVAFDVESDLAALRITGARNLPRPIDINQDPNLVETMPLYVFGFPFGKALAVNKGNPGITVSRGSISSLRRDENGELSVVQINGDLNPGNSGGPVVDAQGRLVGVSVAAIPGTQIGMAIPAAELTQMLKGRIFGLFLYKIRQQQTIVDVNGEVWVFDRKNKVRGGDTINVRVPDVKEKIERDDEFDVDIRLTDPMHNIQSVAIHYLRSDAAVQAQPNAQGLWDPIPEALQVGVKIDDQRAHALLKLPPGGMADQYSFQLVYVNADGRAIYTQPHNVRLSFPKAPPVGPTPAPAVIADAVTLNISPLPDPLTRRYILETLPKLIGAKSTVRASSTKDGMSIQLGPVPDPQAFAAKIDFGDVKVEGRTIMVAAKKIALPPPPAADVARALDDLNSPDRNRRKGGAEQLARALAPLPERRAEVAKALEAQLTETNLWLHRAAAQALVIWAGPENLSGVVAALGNRDSLTRHAALEVLVKFKDPATLPAIAALLANLGDRGEASRALKSMGAAAEKVVVGYLEHQDVFVRAEACNILKDIGTVECLPMLTTLASRDMNSLSGRAARDAIKQVESRR